MEQLPEQRRKTDMTIGEFWRGVFCEFDGTPSFSRVATAFTIFATTLFVYAQLHLTNQLPSYDVILALSVFAMAPYGTNRVTDMVKNVKDTMIGKTTESVSTTSKTVESASEVKTVKPID